MTGGQVSGGSREKQQEEQDRVQEAHGVPCMPCGRETPADAPGRRARPETPGFPSGRESGHGSLWTQVVPADNASRRPGPTDPKETENTLPPADTVKQNPVPESRLKSLASGPCL